MATGLPSVSARAKVAPPPVPTRGHSSHQASSQGVPVQNVGMPMVMPLAQQPVSPAPPMELKATPGGRPAAAQAPHAHTVVESQFGGISRQPAPPASQQQLLLQPIPQQSTTFATGSSEKATDGPSIFETTRRDADKFVPAANPQLPFEDDEDTISRHRPRPAKVYWTCIRILIWISIFLCLWPFSCICLCLAYRSSTRIDERNSERDYLSANCCSRWSLVFITLALISMIVLPLIIILIIFVVVITALPL